MYMDLRRIKQLFLEFSMVKYLHWETPYLFQFDAGDFTGVSTFAETGNSLSHKFVF